MLGRGETWQMTQLQTIEASVVIAFRPPPPRSKTVDATPRETGTVVLFTGTRYERRPDAAEPAAPDETASDLDLAHS